MTDENLGVLFGAFANFYWSVPVSYVVAKLADWHPDVAVQQIERVLNRCTRNIFWHHCSVETDGVDEPELVTEHLIALDREDFSKFIAARVDAPLFNCDEQTLLDARNGLPDIPELNAIMEFGKTELGLDSEWCEQLAHDCVFHQALALCDNQSWVMTILFQERYGKIHFRTIDQVSRFRELGNKLYQVAHNPVLRGWSSAEIENPPTLRDEIPEKDEDIPDRRAEMDAVFAPYGGRESVSELLLRSFPATASTKRKKIGRNEPCPCGSGLKFKKCTCPAFHPEETEIQ